MSKAIYTRILAIVGVTLAALLLVAAQASAIGEGQIEGGNFYRLRNVTKNTAFSDPATADPCEVIQYKIRLHNPGPGVVGSVNVRATLPSAAASSHVSTATVSGQNMQPASVSDSATLSISSAQKITYVSGSTQLLDTNSAVISTLPDGITAGGVNIGDVGVSLEEIKHVQFRVTIDCPPPVTPPPPTPPTPPTPPPTTPPPTVTTTVQKTETQAPTPAALPAAGAGDVVGLFILTTTVSGLGYSIINRRFSL